MVKVQLTNQLVIAENCPFTAKTDEGSSAYKPSLSREEESNPLQRCTNFSKINLLSLLRHDSSQL